MYEGEQEASDKFALYREKRREGDTVISATAIFAAGGARRAMFKNISFSFGGIKQHEKIIFARNLGSMLEAGLALSRALTVLERQTKNEKLRSVVAALNEDIKKGKALSQALQSFPRIFSQLFVAMVKVGEEGGNLSGSLRAIAVQMDKTYAITRKVRGALMYPALIICLIIAIAFLMLIYVVPTLTATFSELKVDLPWSTQIIIFASKALNDHLLVSLSLLLGSALLLYGAAKTSYGKRLFDFGLIHTPIIKNVVREANAARVSRTLSSLLVSGVDIVVALQIANDVVSNSYFRGVLVRASESVEKGNPIAAAFADNPDLYPAFLGEMIAVGEETGKLSEMLGNVGTFYEEEVDQITKDLSTVVEPLIMVVIGVVVGFFAFAMIMPMYSLSNAI